MDDGAAVILSVAKYYSPSGKAIQDTGVTPKVMVTEAEAFVDAEEGQEHRLKSRSRRKKTKMSCLKKAIEVLTKGKTAAARRRLHDLKP